MGLGIDSPLVRKRIDECRQGSGLVKSWKVNGANHFIQLYLDGLRINFYLPTPGWVVQSPAHTHDLGFTSTILYGTFVNTLLDVQDSPDGKYERYTLNKPDAFTFTFDNTYQRCRIRRATPSTYTTGDTYSMDPRQYHRTEFTDTTITYMRRWQEDPVQTYHLVPLGQDVPARPDRTVTPEELPGVWRIIDALCERAGI